MQLAADLSVLHTDVDDEYHCADHKKHNRQRQRCLDGGDPTGTLQDRQIAYRSRRLRPVVVGAPLRTHSRPNR
jgi:hypothetical protein